MGKIETTWYVFSQTPSLLTAVEKFLLPFAQIYAMPATRSRSRSPRRSSGSSYSKDKAGKPNSRELITIKTENKDSDGKDSSSSGKTPESKSNTNAANARGNKPAEKTFRKPSESPASKGGNSGGWNSSNNKSRERKFTGRCRLFVGNLVNCEEAELREMFQKYGEVAEVFVNKDKGFGFVRLVSNYWD